jgi:uncharacterized membrane protein (UPF0127 family)
MQQVTIRNLSRQDVQPIRAGYCESFFCRLRGLTFRRTLPDRWGLLLVQPRDSRLDSAIHMLGMWLDLAVVWINSSADVVDVRLARRGQLACLPAQPACYTLEMSTDYIGEFKIGDKVRIEES